MNRPLSPAPSGVGLPHSCSSNSDAQPFPLSQQESQDHYRNDSAPRLSGKTNSSSGHLNEVPNNTAAEQGTSRHFPQPHTPRTRKSYSEPLRRARSSLGSDPLIAHAESLLREESTTPIRVSFGGRLLAQDHPRSRSNRGAAVELPQSSTAQTSTGVSQKAASKNSGTVRDDSGGAVVVQRGGTPGGGAGRRQGAPSSLQGAAVRDGTSGPVVPSSASRRGESPPPSSAKRRWRQTSWQQPARKGLASDRKKDENEELLGLIEEEEANDRPLSFRSRMEESDLDDRKREGKNSGREAVTISSGAAIAKLRASLGRRRSPLGGRGDSENNPDSGAGAGGGFAGEPIKRRRLDLTGDGAADRTDQ